MVAIGMTFNAQCTNFDKDVVIYYSFFQTAGVQIF